MENYTNLAIILLLFVAGASSYFLIDNQKYEYRASFPESDAPELRLEVADTPEQRRRGLMHRQELEKNTGMIFIYPGEDERSFWMKNTYIPLDMIFVNANRTIVEIHEADPQPNASESKLKRYRSNDEAKYVIETLQGFTAQHGIEEEEEIVLEPSPGYSGE